jgi:hypothetical protein
MTIEYFWFNERAAPPQLMLSHLEDIGRLVEHLTMRPQTMDRARISAVGGNGTRTVFAIERDAFPGAHPDGRIIGTGSLVPVRTPSDHYGLITDVIVIDRYTPHTEGIMPRMVEMLIAEARRLGLNHVDHVSAPERPELNWLYPNAGFELLKTNTYRLALKA